MLTTLQTPNFEFLIVRKPVDFPDSIGSDYVESYGNLVCKIPTVNLTNRRVKMIVFTIRPN